MKEANTTEEVKDCAFQYAYNSRWRDVQIVEDTDLITLSEAKELWKKYLPDFIKKLEDDERPEMVIWINMKNPTDYHESLEHIQSDVKTDGVRIWREIKEYVEVE